MELSMRDYAIITLVQPTHHQGDVRYGTPRAIWCSCISLISSCLAFFKYPGLLEKFNLDCVLVTENQLFKFVSKFRYLRTEDLLQEFLI